MMEVFHNVLIQRYFTQTMRLRWKFWIYCQLDRKSKICFFYFPQGVCFLNWTVPNPNVTAFTSKIQVFCRRECTKKGTPWKWILTIFECKNEFPKHLRLKNQMKWYHLSSFYVSFLSYGPYIAKNCVLFVIYCCYQKI